MPKVLTNFSLGHRFYKLRTSFTKKTEANVSPVFCIFLLTKLKNSSKISSILTISHEIIRSSHWMCSARKSVLRNFAKFTGKHLCQSPFFNKKETLAQVFSCESWEISKNPFFTEHQENF